ncbi:MAG: HAD family hydrolase [Deltaproteobacteria bacterium]|nr:HAD family hydrolase [Deltaproteobacteria bacterium]
MLGDKLFQAAIFVDRDGTIIEDLHYPREPQKVTLIPNAVEGLRLMKEKGYLIFIVSNQSGVGRGLISDAEFSQVHERVCSLLQQSGIKIDGFRYCFHHPEDKCLCRKPGIELIPTSFNQQPLDWAESFAVGDKLCDVELANNLKATGCLVLTGKGQQSLTDLKTKIGYTKVQVFSDLLEMARWIPEKHTKTR